MIEEERVQPLASRLSPIHCGHCGRPVGHADVGVPNAAHRGLCTRCTRDESGRIKVYTYIYVVEAGSRG